MEMIVISIVFMVEAIVYIFYVNQIKWKRQIRHLWLFIIQRSYKAFKVN